MAVATRPPALVELGRRIENTLAGTALLAMALLPVLELALRNLFETGVPGSAGYVVNLTLWVGFLGAMVAAREGRHLGLPIGALALPPWAGRIAAIFAAAAGAAVACGLSWAALQFVIAESDSAARVGGWMPPWAVVAIMPVAFAVLTVRSVLQVDGWGARSLALLGIPAAAAAGFAPARSAGDLLWPGVALLVTAAIFGAPIFIVLGGAALLLLFADGVPVAAIPVETYRIVISPAIPAVPLFTLTGYVLAEGGASRRLVRLFRALFGWLPGGMAIAATLVCAFFTTFNGASGVTIVALGGLLLPVLIDNGFRDRFATGLLTASGSIGLLFPPSLAVILYAVVATIPIPQLFLAAIMPGTLMVFAVCLFGIREGVATRSARQRFDRYEAAAALWQCRWELLLPVIVLGGTVGGVGTLVETAAVSAVYALAVVVVVHRDVHVCRDLPGILVKSVTLIGGVLIIVGVAMGLTNYVVDAEIPVRMAAWVRLHVDSPIVFLLTLNLFLLAVGCLMDIFSAIVVVVPLILPIGEAFGIDPLHLAVIFLVNLELGYLTPPVGMNVFLASYRFDRPLTDMYRSALPFFLLLLGIVLLITFVPWLALGIVGHE